MGASSEHEIETSPITRNHVQTSKDKLNEHCQSLQKKLPHHTVIKQNPISSEEEGINYRCKCSFQIIRNTKNNILQYATRSNQTVQPLTNFPIANLCIQKCMKVLIEKLSKSIRMQEDISSCTFVSSWDESCLVIILNYSCSLLHDQKEFITEAKDLFDLMNNEYSVIALIGRSKNLEMVIDASFLKYSHDHIQLSDTIQIHDQSIKYMKPFDAFQHPNPNVMHKALQWIIHHASAKNSTQFRHLLEFYCGYGAHTIPLAKLNLFESIVAIEYDARLVRACQANMKINEITNLRIVQANVNHYIQKATTKFENLTIVLVDPPRQGLGKLVCEFILKQNAFSYILYISCCSTSLQKDLEFLLDSFHIKDCVMLDLFPGTNSVETLVLLERF